MWELTLLWYLLDMAHKTLTLGERGRLVVPAETRKRLGLEAGDRLVMTEEGGGLRLLPLRERIEALRGAWAPLAPGRDLAGELIAERQAEAARE